MAATVDFGLEAKQGLLDLRSENARLKLVTRAVPRRHQAAGFRRSGPRQGALQRQGPLRVGTRPAEGWRGVRRADDRCEQHHEDAEDDAVDTEWPQVPFSKYPSQEMDRDHGGDRREHRGDDRGASDPVAVGAGEVAVLQQSGGQDRRRGQQEAEPRGVGVVQAAGQPGRHNDPSRLNPRDESGRLDGADHRRLTELHRVQPAGSLCVQALALRQLVHLRAPPVSLGGDQNAAVDDQEDRRRQRLGQRLADDLLQEQAEDPHRNGGRDDQPGQALGRGLNPSAFRAWRRNARMIRTQSRQK